MAKFQKGQSGNPNGRPPKNRALTDLLETAGNVTVDVDGKKVARKRIVAGLAWELLANGEAVLPNKHKLTLDPGDWLGLYKWIYQHIDGPPKTEVDVTSGGERVESIPLEVAASRIAMLLEIAKQRKDES